MYSVSTPDPRAGEPDARHGRKQRVLTHGTPSVTRTIADALVLKDGDLFLVTEPSGSVPRGGDHGLGLYYHDCRYLRMYELRIGGALPVPLGAGVGAGYRASVQLTNPELRPSGGGAIPRDTLGVEWARTLDGAALVLADELRIRNWGHSPVELAVELRFAAGFEDVFQIRGLLDEQLGRPVPPKWQDGVLRFLYHGADGLDRALTVRLPGELAPSGASAAAGTIRLDPRAEHRLSLRLELEEVETAAGRRSPQAGGRSPPPAGPAAETRPAIPWPGGLARVTSDSIALAEILARSFADLQLLKSTLRDRAFIAAGIPWFATLFGRDSLVAALQLLAYRPADRAPTPCGCWRATRATRETIGGTRRRGRSCTSSVWASWPAPGRYRTAPTTARGCHAAVPDPARPLRGLDR